MELSKPLFLKRAGYALIVVGLVFLLIISTGNTISSPLVIGYSYALLGVGVALVVAGRIHGWIHHRRVRALSARCLSCGWRGKAETCYRSEACPECDSEQVVLHDPWVN